MDGVAGARTARAGGGERTRPADAGPTAERVRREPEVEGVSGCALLQWVVSASAANRHNRIHELADGFDNPFRGLDEFDAGAVDGGLVFEVADVRVHDASLDDDRLDAEHHPEIVE